jgi:hypothetical protein
MLELRSPSAAPLTAARSVAPLHDVRHAQWEWTPLLARSLPRANAKLARQWALLRSVSWWALERVFDLQRQLVVMEDPALIVDDNGELEL